VIKQDNLNKSLQIRSARRQVEKKSSALVAAVGAAVTIGKITQRKGLHWC